MLPSPTKRDCVRQGAATGPKWVRVSVFYAISLIVSALARLYWHTSDPTDLQRGPWAMYLHWIGGCGPALGALAVCWLFNAQRLSLGGTQPALAAGMIVVPAAAMGALGVGNPYALEPHLFGAYLGVWIAGYAILEETGWRGYLAQEFDGSRRWVRYTIVGVLWYAWHLSWLNHNPIDSEILTIGFMILASAGIGFVAERTRSILAASAFHLVGNIMGLSTDFLVLMPSGNTRVIIVSVCVIFWLALLRLWRRRDARIGWLNLREPS